MENKSLKMRKILGILLGLGFMGLVVVMPCEILAEGEDKELTGNQGYLVGSPKDVKAKEQKLWRKHKGRLEVIQKKTQEFEGHIEAYKEKRKVTDKVVPAKKGDIAPKGYLVGTPKEKPVAVKKERGQGGFTAGFNVLKEDLKEFHRKVRNRPYPADQSLQGAKGGYIYGEPPAEKPEPEKELARTRGFKPEQALPAIGKGIENLHKTWNIRPHRSGDSEIWGFTFPDMPKKEKKGITRHRGDPFKIVGSAVEAVGADIEKHQATAPVDK